MRILKFRAQKIIYNITAFLFVASFAFSAPHAQAQNATSKDVLKILQQVHQQADGLLMAEFVDPSSLPPKRNYSKRYPRHVYHKARDVSEMMSKLSLMHQLQTSNLSSYQTKALVPTDVLNIVVNMKEQMDVMADYFEVEPQSDEQTENQESLGAVTPTDVYASIAHLQDKLIAIGAVPPKPNDVFKAATIIFDDIQAIARKEGRPDTSSMSGVDEDLTPRDTYVLAFELFSEMNALLEGKPDNFIRGDIVRPYTSQIQKPSPQHVLDLLINMQAEIHALNLAYETNFSYIDQMDKTYAGKTPSDVHYVLRDVKSLLRQFN